MSDTVASLIEIWERSHTIFRSRLQLSQIIARALANAVQ
jgi:hypothetical protein